MFGFKKKKEKFSDSVGLGNSHPHNQPQVAAGSQVTEKVAEELYNYGGLGRAIVDCLVGSMIRPWFSVEDEGGTIERELSRLNAREVFQKLLIYNEVYGGSLCVIGSRDGNLESEYKEGRKSRVEYLQTFKPDSVKEIERDEFLNPTLFELYKGNGESFKVHASKVMWFRGNLKLGMDSMFGGSIYESIIEGVDRLDKSYESVSTIMRQFVTIVLKLDGMSELLGDKAKADALRKVLQNISKYRDSENVIAIGEGDDFNKVVGSVSGLDNLIKEFQVHISTITGIPVSILFGRLGAGLNSNKEGDFRQFYDMIDWKRETILRKPVQKLVNILSGKNKHEVKFGELMREDKKEAAEILEKKSKAYQFFLENEVVGEEEVRGELGFEEK